jgi:hypothetical protein
MFPNIISGWKYRNCEYGLFPKNRNGSPAGGQGKKGGTFVVVVVVVVAVVVIQGLLCGPGWP